ncbi:MAG: hypothetical protein J1F71_05445 [Clostridiales bacterium]|nr:hypothetical protein [Clostridiales bacterium]
MKSRKRSKGFWITSALVLLIAALFCVALLPTVLEKQKRTEAAAEVSVDAEAMRILGCCNAYVAANGFSTAMSGSVKASVVGVPYTQKIKGGRQVSADGSFTDTAESKSALVKAAVKREYRDGSYIVSRGEYKKKAFKYGKGEKLSKSNYVSKYGKPFTGIVKYNTDGAVISAQAVGENVYKFVLDPVKSTAYCRNEVKTVLGGKSYPTYKSVEFTLTTDGEKPIKVVSVEKFRIDKFGGTDCTAEYTENFVFN